MVRIQSGSQKPDESRVFYLLKRSKKRSAFTGAEVNKKPAADKRPGFLGKDLPKGSAQLIQLSSKKRSAFTGAEVNKKPAADKRPGFLGKDLPKGSAQLIQLFL